MIEAAATALVEVEVTFEGHQVLRAEDGQGGAYVIVEDLDIGSRFSHARSWVGFQIGFQYPRAHVYPYYVRGDLSRPDQTLLQPPFAAGGNMPGFNRPAVVVSRASRGWNPAIDTAARKLLRILLWLRETA